MAIDTSLEFVPINIAVLTISDTRTSETDTSGALLQERINSSGHQCIEKKIIPDDIHLIKKTLQNLSKKKEIDCIITTGGTGLLAVNPACAVKNRILSLGRTNILLM